MPGSRPLREGSGYAVWGLAVFVCDWQDRTSAPSGWKACVPSCVGLCLFYVLPRRAMTRPLRVRLPLFFVCCVCPVCPSPLSVFLFFAVLRQRPGTGLGLGFGCLCAPVCSWLLALRPFLWLSRSSEVLIAAFSGQCRILIALAVQGSGFGVA